MRWILVGVLVVLIGRQSAVSQIPAPIDPKKAALIREIVNAAVTGEQRRVLLNQAVQSATLLVRMNSVYPPAFVNELEQKLRDRFAALDLSTFVAPVYAKTFTEAELEQIRTFVTSPVGRKFAGLQPQVYRDLNAALVAWSRNAEAAASKEVLAAHPEYGKPPGH